MTADYRESLKVGKQLVALCREGKNLDAINTLYSDKIVSIEVIGDETMPARMEGIEAVRQKNHWWFKNHEVHSSTAAGPFPHGNRFIVYFTADITAKAGPAAGQRDTIEEAGVHR